MGAVLARRKQAEADTRGRSRDGRGTIPPGHALTRDGWMNETKRSVDSDGVRDEGRLVGVLCVGYVRERPLSTLMTDFLRRSALVVVTALERISAYRELVAALDLAHLKGDIVGFMFTHGNYGEIREFIGRKVCEIVGAQHLLLISDDGSRNDCSGRMRRNAAPDAWSPPSTGTGVCRSRSSRTARR